MTTTDTTRRGAALPALPARATGRFGVLPGSVAAVVMAFALVVGSAATLGDGGTRGSEARTVLAQTGAELVVVGELARGALGHPFP